MPTIICNGNEVELLEARTPIEIPSECPMCQTATEMDGANLKCPNEECEGRGIRKIRRWMKSLEIKHVGPSTEQCLWDSELVRDPADLYIMPVDKLAECCSGTKVAVKIMAEINKKRSLTLPQFFGSLGVRFLGKRSVQLIIENGGPQTFEEWLDPEPHLHIDGVKEKMREGICNGIAANRELIDKLIEANVIIETSTTLSIVAEKSQPSGALAGLSFCFTGKIEKTDENGKRYTRNMMEDLAIQAGGSIEKVTKNLTYLVTADVNSNSSKAKKARNLDIQILSEDEFFGMVK